MSAVLPTPLPMKSVHVAGVLAISYFLSTWLSMLLFASPGGVAVIWLANTVAAVQLAHAPLKHHARLLGVMAASGMLAHRLSGVDWLSALLYQPANMLECAVAGVGLKWLHSTARLKDSTWRFMALMGWGGVLAPALGALSAALLLGLWHEPDAWRVCLTWFESSMVGAVSLLPLVFTLYAQDGAQLRRDLLGLPSLALQLLTLGFGMLALALTSAPFAYMALPLLVSAAWMPVVAVQLACFLLVLCVGLARSFGVYAPPPILPRWPDLLVFLPLLATLLPLQLLSASVSELRSRERDLKLSLDRLAQSNRKLEQFVRVATHDLREPANTMSGFMRLLEPELKGQLSPEAQMYVQQVGDGLRRLRKTLDEVHAFLRLDTGAPAPLEAVSVPVLWDQALKEQARALKSAEVTVDLRELPLIPGHSCLLRDMFKALLCNAIQFKAAERPLLLHIRGAVSEGWMKLSLQDNGIGIADDDQALLFELFSRVHERGRYEGTGLGLARCKRIADLHGGRIWMESVFGVGSCVHVHLPLEGTKGLSHD